MPKNHPQPLQISIAGKQNRLTLDAFLILAQETVHILRAIDATSPDRESKLEWLIESASKASPLTMTITAEDVDPRRMERAITTFVRAVEDMNERPSKPEEFPVSALPRLNRIVDLLNDGVGVIAFGVGTRRVMPTQHVSANIAVLLDPHEIRTTIEGHLESVRAHHKRFFRVWNLRTGDSVQCSFRPEFNEDVKRGLFRRVSVTGRAQYLGGKPDSIVVEKLEVLDDNGIAFDDLPPMNITGGLSAAEYLRKVRDGE